MGNYLCVGGGASTTMAVKDTQQMGIRHVTVVPENFRPDDERDDDAEANPGPARE